MVAVLVNRAEFLKVNARQTNFPEWLFTFIIASEKFHLKFISKCINFAPYDFVQWSLYKNIYLLSALWCYQRTHHERFVNYYSTIIINEWKCASLTIDNYKDINTIYIYFVNRAVKWLSSHISKLIIYAEHFAAWHYFTNRNLRGFLGYVVFYVPLVMFEWLLWSTCSLFSEHNILIWPCRVICAMDFSCRFYVILQRSWWSVSRFPWRIATLLLLLNLCSLIIISVYCSIIIIN